MASLIKESALHTALYKRVKALAVTKLHNRSDVYKKELNTILKEWQAHIRSLLSFRVSKSSRKSRGAYPTISIGLGLSAKFPHMDTGELMKAVKARFIRVYKSKTGLSFYLNYGFYTDNLLWGRKHSPVKQSYAEYLQDTTLVRWKKSDYIKRSMRYAEKVVLKKFLNKRGFTNA